MEKKKKKREEDVLVLVSLWLIGRLQPWEELTTLVFYLFGLVYTYIVTKQTSIEPIFQNILLVMGRVWSVWVDLCRFLSKWYQSAYDI